jgi:hypothetical protein
VVKKALMALLWAVGMYGTGGPATINRRLRSLIAIAWATGSVALLAVALGVAQADISGTGFPQPFAGTPRYLKYAPTEATTVRQINRPLGTKLADRIARALGLSKRKAFTARQYRLFVSGKGVGGDPASAKLVDQSVRILTNTIGTPLYAKVDGKLTPVVVGSYGLMVNTAGMLMSPANKDAPTRQVNEVIKPGGYMATWCRNNGAQVALRTLYRSAYTSEVVYGNRAQKISGAAQLIPNQKGRRGSIVGMSMGPSLWIVNFALIYTLNPSRAANMPARWAPMPAKVALAIAESPNGQVPYSKYASYFSS